MTVSNLPDKVDILAIGAHPDDIEIFMGGAMIRFAAAGQKTAVCDLTRGEAGTYGDAATREQELKKASEILGLTHRVTLEIPDGGVRNIPEYRMPVINIIRRFQPELVFSFTDTHLRHPDHANCGQLVRECCYLAGLQKIKTDYPAFRPAAFITFPELVFEQPTFVIDVTPYQDQRRQAIQCFGSQVITPGMDDSGTKTFIHSNSFWEILDARGTLAGAMIGVRYGEPFYCVHPPRLDDPITAFRRNLR